jgi:hypothetical protein
MLLSHPLIAMHVQSYGLPGKRRRARKRLNVFERNHPDGRPSLSFPVDPPVLEYDSTGAVVGARVTPRWDHGFHMGRFSRALHMIAYNLGVLNRGLEMAFSPRYAAVRAYVRKPKAKEMWPFAHLVERFENVNLVPTVHPLMPSAGNNYAGDCDLVVFSIFNMHFFVDLINSDSIREGGIRISEPVGEMRVIGPDWTPRGSGVVIKINAARAPVGVPPFVRTESGDGERMEYRLTIE